LSEKKGMMNYTLKSIRNFFLRLKTYRFMKHMVLEFENKTHNCEKGSSCDFLCMPK
jgi:hypothetical protein